MKRGQITIAMIMGGISIIGSVLGFGGYFNSKIENTNARIGVVESRLTGIDVKLDFILGKYDSKFNQNTGIVEPIKSYKIATSTKQ